VFAHNCTTCHSLVGNESKHKDGGDLVGYHLTRAELTLVTRTMPTRHLTAAELQAVVGYVMRAQQRGRSGP
jgi:mono/diheme cytochrome c family protein